MGIWDYADDGNQGNTCPYYAGPDYVKIAPLACQSDGVTSWKAGCSSAQCVDSKYYINTYSTNALCSGPPTTSSAFTMLACINVLTVFTATTAAWAAPSLLKIPGVQILSFGDPSVIATFTLTNLPFEVIVALIFATILVCVFTVSCMWYCFFIYCPKRREKAALAYIRNKAERL